MQQAIAAQRFQIISLSLWIEVFFRINWKVKGRIFFQSGVPLSGLFLTESVGSSVERTSFQIFTFRFICKCTLGITKS